MSAFFNSFLVYVVVMAAHINPARLAAITPATESSTTIMFFLGILSFFTAKLNTSGFGFELLNSSPVTIALCYHVFS